MVVVVVGMGRGMDGIVGEVEVGLLCGFWCVHVFDVRMIIGIESVLS